MSTPQQLQNELNKIRQAIAGQEGLRGILSDEQIEASLAELREKEAKFVAQIEASGEKATGNTIKQAGNNITEADDGGIAIGGNVQGNLNQIEIKQEIGSVTGSGRVTGIYEGDTVAGDKHDNRHITYIIQQTDHTADDSTLREELTNYLNWVIATNRTITLRGVQHSGRNVIELDLDTVYVPLTAKVNQWGKSFLLQTATEPLLDREQNIQLNQVLTMGERIVITGGPGCGKTTVLMHIAWTLAAALVQDNPALAQEKLSLETPLPLPIFLPINRYANHLRKEQLSAKQRSLAAFIAEYLNERQKEVPSDFFRQLLKKGKNVILLLDGLDEVPNEHERVQVTQAIEDLAAAHPQLRVLVTCRTAAYKDRVALGHGFREVKVQPLDEESLTKLIRQAYQAVEPDSEARQNELAQELLDGIAQMERERQRRLGENTEKLVNSPLLVRMLLLVHLSERRLPEQRAELYSKAIDNMILPDYGRDAAVRDEIGALVGDKIQHLELVQFIAFKMHQQGGTQGREIDEPELKRLFRQEPKLAGLVESFIATTRERGTLMEERLGTYRFIHLAFQEFLVARYMVEALWFEHKLPDFIRQGNCLTDSWWREPLLLLGGYLSITFARQAENYVRYLAGIDGRPLNDTTQTERWAGAELAATVLLEWPTAADTLKQAVAQRLADLIMVDDTSTVPARLRADLGMVLGRLGDPRPGVGVKNGLPDIVWGEIVPAGMYTIGSEQDGDNPVQEIEIKEPYQLAIYPVTAAQYQSFMDAPDYEDKQWWEGMPVDEKKKSDQSLDYPNHPRETVSWYQATAFCRWLSAKTDERICLPHEHQWEVAARFNDERIYLWGNEFDGTKANTREIYISTTTAVGLYPQGKNPNLNLYDLSGNVYEWCCNKYGNPALGTVDDSGDRRVLRGGSFGSLSDYVRAAFRHDYLPGARYDYHGFRLCVVRPPSS